MKKNLSLSLLGSSLIFVIIPLKADVIIPAGTIIKTTAQDTDIDIIFDRNTYNNSADVDYREWKFNNDTSCSDPLGNGNALAGASGAALNKACHERVGLFVDENSDGSVDLGNGSSQITVNNEGISKGGKNLIKQKANGELHIGENSWITKEEGGRQKVYAKDANGNPIPIDYTNGTKLLINGRDVEQSINNVGALSAALTGLPTVPTDTTLACGLGTGTHGGDFAFSGGCASKVNEKLSINYAASMTMPGQDYAGDFEDTFSARAGFVWKLGKSVNPSLIIMKAKEKMEVKINALEEKNTNLENTVSTLMAKLERLEKIALRESQSQNLATIKLPF